MKVTGVSWSLTKILEHYSLIEKHNVQETERHSAGFDAMCLHWIMQEYRKEIYDVPESFGSSPSIAVDHTTKNKVKSRKRKARRPQRKV